MVVVGTKLKSFDIDSELNTHNNSPGSPFSRTWYFLSNKPQSRFFFGKNGTSSASIAEFGPPFNFEIILHGGYKSDFGSPLNFEIILHGGSGYKTEITFPWLLFSKFGPETGFLTSLEGGVVDEFLATDV